MKEVNKQMHTEPNPAWVGFCVEARRLKEVVVDRVLNVLPVLEDIGTSDERIVRFGCSREDYKAVFASYHCSKNADQSSNQVDGFD